MPNTHPGPTISTIFHLQSPTFLSIVTAMFHGPLMHPVDVEVDQKDVIDAGLAKHRTLQAACNPSATAIHLEAWA